jgi:hypothetical protein
MAEKHINERKLTAGEYAPHKKGGQGYWINERYSDGFGGWKTRPKWIWVAPPRGYEVTFGGGLQLKKREIDPKKVKGTTFIAESARDIEKN